VSRFRLHPHVAMRCVSVYVCVFVLVLLLLLVWIEREHYMRSSERMNE
jgi:DNA-binding transcriptional regulator of glucitol operon